MTKPHTTNTLKRALWLAFQASSPMGMGVLHATASGQQTEESLFESMTRGNPNPDVIDTDYVFGRMMKTNFELSDGKLVIHPETPRRDYQSWGSKYASAQELISEAETAE